MRLDRCFISCRDNEDNAENMHSTMFVKLPHVMVNKYYGNMKKSLCMCLRGKFMNNDAKDRVNLHRNSLKKCYFLSVSALNHTLCYL